MTDGRMKPKGAGQTGRTLLARWILMHRMTQAEAAELISISRVKLNQYVNGEARPSLETAIRIEDVTGIGVRCWLLADPGPAAGPTAADPERGPGLAAGPVTTG